MIREIVAADGLRGLLLVPEERGRYPGVVVLGGSGGGWRAELAAALAEHGLACLALMYFGADGLPAALVEVPLEYVETAVRWLAARPEVLGLPIGVVGGSKGAELCLLTAATFPELIGPVVALAPSSVVFFGLDPVGDDPSAVLHSSWSCQGRPVPFVPYPRDAEPESSQSGLAVAPIYAAALADDEAVLAATIPVERARGPMLLVSGDDDRMWPAARMGEMVVARLAQHGRLADVTHLCYSGAGHRLLESAAAGSTGSPRKVLFDYGGTEDADARARADARAKAALFLRRHLA